ncbi:virulence factor SrfB family protein [Yersinia pseudotuberculosis IP 32953]|uniref:Putative virulence factor n=1 Tax=Yersinia pseudotuberculosis serotype I (strain IP32953) TaxID=273123 RepID=Q66AB9_YERPS|nr:virulence factor SrfB [Yersinia pseudotuberculosis]AJJ53421.1 virulence factor SrfB family protein [Yersinia pseudotuberculosis IP 32953]PSH44775.1 virulence factor SrfB [Yersinia pseudotuberculosis]PSH46515.1 virulence factor SrfB [Yersinia pseudotuberculosis]CAH21451.1 putative virulence factor [Yersinia pseudotuberculosis IP 32953]
MLATITDYKQKITLIQDSGIQFLDFALTPESDTELPNKFVRKSANGPLLRLNYHEHNGKYSLMLPGAAPEIVKPEFSIPLEQSLKLLNQIWLPLPFLRFTPPHTFIRGPDNWARVQILTLDTPDQDGNTLRVTLAFDTKVYPESHDNDYLAPTENDIKTGLSFALAYHNEDLAEFLDLTWVDGWLRDVFTQQAAEQEERTARHISASLREFEYQAHYLNVLALLGSQLRIPEIKITTNTLQEPAVNVDLILDVGNSHTCGILVEDHADESYGLNQTYELQLRDLSEPHYLYNALFESRVEFAQAKFGQQSFSVESGREDAFIWPSITRVGHEACRMALQRLGTEGSTGISSPRRYLWDEESYAAGWRFSGTPTAPHEGLATALPLTLLLNDDGEPLYRLPAEERLPVFSPHYSRSSLMTFMLSELLAQALMQINSAAQRLKMIHVTAPRQLRSIILTLPSAMPKPEREIFRQRMNEAIALVWKSMGWHPADDDFVTPADHAKSKVPVPDVQMEWDEATCGQMVYLYNETQVNFGGRTAAFFASMARPDKQLDAGETAGKTLRIASIDIGGGTTDLAITQYGLDEGIGNNVKISPRLLFREGFKVAGDDILLDIIQLYILPALQATLKKMAVVNSDGVMDKLFGNDGRMDGQSVLRQQATLQIFMPVGRAILEAYENFDPLDTRAEIEASFGELLTLQSSQRQRSPQRQSSSQRQPSSQPQQPTLKVLEYINSEIQRELPPDAGVFDILQVPLVLKLSQLHGEFLSNRMSITQNLRALSEVVSLYACDVLLLTGRPSRFPGIQALFRHLQPLPNNRILSLDGYHTNDWYPFNKLGRIDNPKSTAAVGAMLCLLALNLRLAGFYFKAGDFQPYSTICYLGMLSSSHTLTTENVYYRDIDLDSADYKLPSDVHFQLRGSLSLGFRQLDNDRWPASPLYTLSIVEQELARKIAGNSVLSVKLKLAKSDKQTGLERFELAEAKLQDGSRVPLHHLRLKLNTLASNGSGSPHYWIDSGSVFRK